MAKAAVTRAVYARRRQRQSGDVIDRLKQWARMLKRDIVVLWLAARDPRTPWTARIVAGATAAYALSPIDLIPDVVPVLGLIDDLLIVPAGIWLALRMMPAPLIGDLRRIAEARMERPVSRGGAVAVVILWMLAVAVLARWLMR